MRRSEQVAVPRSRGAVLAALAALLVLVTTACAQRPDGAIATATDLRGARFVVGGGPTDELELLCQLTVAAVEAAGATASDQCARYGAFDVRLPAGRSFVDTGWGYPARADRDLDGRDDPPASPDAAARADAARGLTWLPPTAFSDGDVLVVPAGGGPTTVSGAAGRPGTWCAPPGASTARLLAVYRPRDGVRILDRGAVVTGVARGTCTAGLVANTSGYLPALGLVPLVDDRDALPRGGAAPVLRTDVVVRHPGIRTVLAMLTPRLTDEVVRGLNREVTLSGRDARDVAREWLHREGLV